MTDLYFTPEHFEKLHQEFYYAKDVNGCYMLMREHVDIKMSAEGLAYFAIGEQKFFCNDKHASMYYTSGWRIFPLL